MIFKFRRERERKNEKGQLSQSDIFNIFHLCLEFNLFFGNGNKSIIMLVLSETWGSAVRQGDISLFFGEELNKKLCVFFVVDLNNLNQKNVSMKRIQQQQQKSKLNQIVSIHSDFSIPNRNFRS